MPPAAWARTPARTTGFPITTTAACSARDSPENRFPSGASPNPWCRPAGCCPMFSPILAGNTHCDAKYLSFLTKDRFCERNGRIAKQFEVELHWADGTKSVTSLNAKPDPNNVELVKYIPQTYLEKVCTETEPGQQSEFQRELRKVIFSHIGDADKLGKESLDELIEYKTEELAEQRNAQRQEISRLNGELVRLEVKDSVDYAYQLEAKLKLKRQE